MKNIILQHWTGELNELAELSSISLQKYAKQMNADYHLLRGNVFRDDLTPALQKLHMLNEKFDDYDYVMMIDMDAFCNKNIKVNFFTEVEGIGRFNKVQLTLRKRLAKHGIGDESVPYWGGSIYRLSRKVRKTLRVHMNKIDFRPFNKPYHYEDEGVMHVLAQHAGYKHSKKMYLDTQKWNIGSFQKGVESGCTIHIRTKIAPKGPKRPKIENYRDLVKRGII